MSAPHLDSAEVLVNHFFSKLSSIIQTQDLHCKRTGVAVAYSGGLDSTVLLVLTSLYAQQQQIPLFAYHINHGLSSFALDWQNHCQNVCLKLGIPFKAKSVSIKNQGQGIESVARSERYRALGQLCDADNAGLLLVAHHLDDQAETMLMQLFRGTGLRGLAGMDESNFAPGLLNTSQVRIGRPLLSASRKAIQDYAIKNKLIYIEDDSNTDLRYTRNATRHLLMPKIEDVFPHFSDRLLRTSQHIRSAQRLLDDLAANDLKDCAQDNSLDIMRLTCLNADRISNVFRYWLSQNQVQLPSTSKIAEILQQLLSAREDARVSIRHGEFSICRYASKIFLLNHRYVGLTQFEIVYSWSGEQSKYFPELKGTLLFQLGQFGILASQLKNKQMVIRSRRGGERLKLAKNRPTRDLKSHFQSARIPFWQREKLPLIYLDDHLFFVGLLGIDAAFLEDELQHVDKCDSNVQLVWVPDKE